MNTGNTATAVRPASPSPHALYSDAVFFPAVGGQGFLRAAYFTFASFRTRPPPNPRKPKVPPKKKNREKKEEKETRNYPPGSCVWRDFA